MIRVITAKRYKRLVAIEKEARWVAKGRAISRQAALNCIPDLIRAVEGKKVGR